MAAGHNPLHGAIPGAFLNGAGVVNYGILPQGPPPGPPTCSICGEISSNLQNVGCDHLHCNNCIAANVRASLNPNDVFAPAKCCRVIPHEILVRAGTLSDDELTKYSDQMEELTSPHGRLYCWGPDCGAYILNANRTKRIGKCTKCARRTCIACLRKSHFGACDKTQMDAERETDDAVFRLAKSRGWKRCPNCLTLVQRNGGCNSITCLCTQLFCYQCGGAFVDGRHDCPHRQRQAEQMAQRREEQRQQQQREQQ
ncbi:hypothetical protein GGR51DRAFT_347259 [Nemania sp. FL0031]|nr:hypothetical protein GGR51DRAFT_347259 [Nemania sp. FL0031]